MTGQWTRHINTSRTISMSAEALSRLSLGDTMVTTRAQAMAASRARTTPPHTPQLSSSSSSSSLFSETPSPTPSLIESGSGLTYNVSAFDENVRRRAKIGLMEDNDIKMKYCKMSTDDRMKYTFYIDDDITVAMGGSYSVPRCSCGANEGGKACKHIFWMLDQLATGAPPHIRAQTLQLAEDGSTVHTFKPSHMIDKMGLETVADGLDWALQYGQSLEVKEIEEEIAEMLSVFEPSDALPADSKDPSACPSERSRKFRQFRDLFAKYATENVGMFIQLQAVIDRDFQAQVFFEKINDRTCRVFKALEEYMANGPTPDALTESYDIATCAKKLKGLVKAIDEYYHEKMECDNDTKDIAIRAAAALISILDGVANRNFDAYANITWGGIPPVDAAENNLFINLIGAPAQDDGLFVIDTLKALPHDAVLRNHWEALLNLEEKLMQQRPSPLLYMKTFHTITQESRKRSASDSGGTSTKRTMQ